MSIVCRMTVSANAGIALALGNCRVWVDVLHQKKVPGFSAVSRTLLETLQKHPDFQSPTAICVTHCHDDHYSPGLLARTKARFPDAQIYHPDPDFPGGILLEGDVWETDLDGCHLKFFRLPHAGKPELQCDHYGILVSTEGRNILCVADCEVASPVLAQKVAGVPIHAAVLPFPWFTLPRGRQFITEVIRPEQVVLNHLPFAEDDVYGYREIVSRELERTPLPMPCHILKDPFQSIDILL